MHIAAPVAELDRASRRPAPASAASDAALLDLCARWHAAYEGACAFGDLVNGMPGDHDRFVVCGELDAALSRTLDGIALQISRTLATTTPGLAAKARIVRYAAVGAADDVQEFENGGAVAIALAQSFLADLETAQARSAVP